MPEPTELRKALGIAPGAVVALTGGGGKSSLALALLRELWGAGLPALFTTTTRTFPLPGLPTLFAEELPPDQLPGLLRNGPICLGQRLDRETGKVVGIAPDEVSRLKGRLDSRAVLLVEADGASGLPLKAPAPHEPVIPPAADLVLPVAGATALGRLLLPGQVHRPERVAAVAGVAPGSPVTPAVVAAALLSPDGCTRGAPPGARLVPVIGQADAPDVNAAALQELLTLLTGRAGRAVLAAPQSATPVRAVAGPVAAIVLAGGASRRFGGSKLLHPYAPGFTLLEAALRAPLQADLREVLVVTGADHEVLAPLLAPYPVQVIANRGWRTGMASSMQAGLRALPDDVQAAVICLGDQPELPAQVIDALAETWRRTGAPVVAPTAGSRWRNPVLFDRSLWPELLQVTGDEGGRSVVRHHADRMLTLPFAEAAWFADVDTRQDL